MTYFFDSNRVRYELRGTGEGKPYNWLFLPGGPGADSRYLHSLVDLLKLQGNKWLIDLPGNGDNSARGGEDYEKWFEIFLPVMQRFKNPILVGHSFGGMFPLLFPELEKVLKGFIILHSTPSLWLQEAVSYAKQFNLPDLTEEMSRFTQDPNEITFKCALEACMPYYFPPRTLEKGRALLTGIPFPYQSAVWWLRKAIELNFSARWVPQRVETLIIGGTHDCIVPPTLFQKESRFHRSNIKMVTIEGGGHCAWLESPQLVKQLFEGFTPLSFEE